MTSPGVVLCVNFCVTGIYEIAFSGEIRNCTFASVGVIDTYDSICTSPDLTILTYYSRDSTLPILCFANVVFLVLAKYVFFVVAGGLHRFYSRQKVTSRDYSLLIKIKRSALTWQEPIETVVDRLVNPPGRRDADRLWVVKISPVFDIWEVTLAQNRCWELEKIIRRKKAKGKSAEKVEGELIAETAKLLALKEEVRIMRDQRFSGWVFVTFTTPKARSQADKRIRPFLNLFIGSHWYRLAHPPEAGDIIWENWGVSFRRRMLGRLLTLVATLVFSGVTFCIILGLKYGQNRVLNLNLELFNSSSVGVPLLSVLMSVIINGINIGMKLVLIYLTKFEYYKTKTSMEASITSKIILFNFVNKGLVLLFTNLVTSNQQSWAIFGLSGVAGNIIISQIIGVFVDSLLLVANPVYFLKKFQRWRVRRSIARDQKFYCQIEANEIFEHLEFRLSEIYAMFFECVCLAFFYQALIPYGLILGFVELLGKYWAVKYVLVRRCKAPEAIGFDFTLRMFKVFEFAVMLLAFGYLTFFYIFRNNGESLSLYLLIAVIVAAADWVLGVQVFGPLFNSHAKGRVEEPFSSIAGKLREDYDWLNPMTSAEAKEKFRAKIKEKYSGASGKDGLSRQTSEDATPNQPKPGEGLIFVAMDSKGHLDLPMQPPQKDPEISDREKEDFKKSLRKLGSSQILDAADEAQRFLSGPTPGDQLKEKPENNGKQF